MCFFFLSRWSIYRLATAKTILKCFEIASLVREKKIHAREQFCLWFRNCCEPSIDMDFAWECDVINRTWIFLYKTWIFKFGVFLILSTLIKPCFCRNLFLLLLLFLNNYARATIIKITFYCTCSSILLFFYRCFYKYRLCILPFVHTYCFHAIKKKILYFVLILSDFVFRYLDFPINMIFFLNLINKILI